MTNAVKTVLRYQVRDAARSRWLGVYAVFFLVATEGLLRFAGGDAKAILSLMSVVLFVVPLVTLVLGTVYLYGAREFIELLLAQPVSRRDLFAGLYLGLTVPLAVAFTGGVAIPFALRGGAPAGEGGALATVLLAGVALSCVFTAIAFVVATRAVDRLRGLGLAIGVWLLLALLYDAVVLVVVATFADYPIERPLLVLTFANPIDLARVVLLLRLDVAALMGYTGAVFQRFFGSTAGMVAASAGLAAWIAVPIAIGARSFQRRDF